MGVLNNYQGLIPQLKELMLKLDVNNQCQQQKNLIKRKYS